MNTIRINTVIKDEKLMLTDLKKFIGKRVDILISEAQNKKDNKKKWKHSGSADLNGLLDDKNIRNLAYE